MKRTIRNRRLTPDEIEADRRVREQIETEKPEINAIIKQRMAEISRAKAADQDPKRTPKKVARRH